MGYYDRHGGRNRYEATLKYGGAYYFGGGIGSEASPQAIMNEVCERSYWKVAPTPPAAYPFEVAEDWPLAPSPGSPFHTP